MIRTALILASFALCQAAAAQADTDSTALFRYAYFGEDWTVTLDEPVAVPSYLLESGAVAEVKSGVYRLGFYQSFDYAAVPIVVTITADSDDLAVSLRFDYGEEYDFDHERRSYEETLGTPASSDDNTVVWEDAVTHFKLVRGVGGNSYSVLQTRRGR
ncbi:MAG: hypothetical protein AAF791_01200 [Bacteroidota bacterium]